MNKTLWQKIYSFFGFGSYCEFTDKEKYRIFQWNHANDQRRRASCSLHLEHSCIDSELRGDGEDGGNREIKQTGGNEK